MKEEQKTRAQLLEELKAMRTRIAVLSTSLDKASQKVKMLKKNEEMYRSLFNGNHNPVFLFSLKPDHSLNKFIEVNELFCNAVKN